MRTLLFTLISLAACSGDDDGSTPARDAGSRDARTPVPDTGAPGEDSGTPAEDSGTPGEDAATPMDAAADAPIGSDAGSPSACNEITDAALFALVYGGAPRVPPGYYFETDEAMAYANWQSPCSSDLADTRARATTAYGAAALTGEERTTEQFYEVDADSGGFTVHFRNTRCDYYDGSTFGGAPHDSADRIPLLASYLWWVDFYNLSGSSIAAGVTHPGGPPHEFDLCHVQTVYGDFGLCDEITLKERSFTVARDGATSIATDRDIRTVMGMCH
jgi:hypothetical protein